MESFSLQKLADKDMAALLDLPLSMGWDYTADDIATILKVGKVFGHKTSDGQLISSAAIFPYSHELASLGLVIVKLEYQGHGLGKAVVQKCLDSLNTIYKKSKKVPTMLIATAEGLPLYERLGFKTVTHVQKFICEKYGASSQIELAPNNQVNPLRDSDFYQIVKLDAAAIGADRRHFLESRIRQAKAGFGLRLPDGSLIGFGLSVQGSRMLTLGPIVAPDNALAMVLVDVLAENHVGTLRLDIPIGLPHLRASLLERGFVQVTEPPVMLINATELPSRNNTLFAIAAQAFG